MPFFVLRQQKGTSRNAWELVSDVPVETREEADKLAAFQTEKTLILEPENAEE